MFEVDVKNVMDEGKGRRGPARVWGSDVLYFVFIDNIYSYN